MTLLGVAPSIDAAPAHQLQGTVYDEGGQPLSSVCVGLDGGAGIIDTAMSDVDGTWSVPVEAGQYRVRFTDCRALPTHVTQWWNGHATQDTADVVKVVDSDVDLGSTTMQPGVSITGTISAPDGNGLEQANVNVWSEDRSISTSTSTANDGSYRSAPLPDGNYLVRVDGPNGYGQPTRYWTSSWTRSGASVLTLARVEGTERSGIDVAMVKGASLEGRVTNAQQSPLAGICVTAVERVKGDPGDQIGSTTTGPDGSYRLASLPPVETLVQFHDCSSSGYRSEWYDDATDPANARVTYLQEGSQLSGVDATLVQGAAIAGTVTDQTGEPIGGICVEAVTGIGEGASSLASTGTDENGNYRLEGLDPVKVRVRFDDCKDVGPYIAQWFDDTSSFAEAEELTLEGGATVKGVDATLLRAGTVSGRVTDASGPAATICVQASDTSGVAATDETDDKGEYQLEFARAGSFAIQFVDCSEQPSRAGEWWRDAPTRSTSTPVEVRLGEKVVDVSPELATGAAGSVRGRVTNVRGVPMGNACAVVYLAHGAVRFDLLDDDGTFEVANIGSGTWAVGFLDCESERDVNLVVSDPDTRAIAYRAHWLGGRPLLVNDEDDGPDPIAQGAVLVDVPAGGVATADSCFGCGLVTAEVQRRFDDTATFTFDAPDLLDGTLRNTAAAATVTAAAGAAIDYQVACVAAGRPQLTSAVVDTTSAPVGVSGLTAGSEYGCVVTASVDGTAVANSASLPVVVPAAPPGPPSDAVDPATSPSADGRSGATPRQLAFTGSELLPMLVVGLVLLLLGIVATSTATVRLVRLARSSRER